MNWRTSSDGMASTATTNVSGLGDQVGGVPSVKSFSAA